MDPFHSAGKPRHQEPGESWEGGHLECRAFSYSAQTRFSSSPGGGEGLGQDRRGGLPQLVGCLGRGCQPRSIYSRLTLGRGQLGALDSGAPPSSGDRWRAVTCPIAMCSGTGRPGPSPHPPHSQRTPYMGRFPVSGHYSCRLVVPPEAAPSLSTWVPQARVRLQLSPTPTARGRGAPCGAHAGTRAHVRECHCNADTPG